MQIKYWVIINIIILLFIQNKLHAENIINISNGKISWTVKNKITTLTIQRKNNKIDILNITEDGSYNNDSEDYREIYLIGEIQNKSIVFVEGSEESIMGTALCGSNADTSAYLHVVSLVSKPAKETFKIKVQDCGDVILHNDDIKNVIWDSSKSNVEIKWDNSPSGLKNEFQIFHINDDGTAEKIKSGIFKPEAKQKSTEIIKINDRATLTLGYDDADYYISLKKDGIQKQVKLLDPLDYTNIPNQIGIIGNIDEKYSVIVKIKHPIKPSTSQCGAGVEATLSIISLSIYNPREIYTEKIASCGYNIELASSENEHNIKIGDYFSWNKDDILIDQKQKKITLKWGYNPTKEGINKTMLIINPDGKVTEFDSK